MERLTARLDSLTFAFLTFTLKARRGNHFGGLVSDTFGSRVDGRLSQSAIELTLWIRPKMATMSATGILSAVKRRVEKANSGPLEVTVISLFSGKHPLDGHFLNKWTYLLHQTLERKLCTSSP